MEWLSELASGCAAWGVVRVDLAGATGEVAVECNKP
jgi:hypothetical protein